MGSYALLTLSLLPSVVLGKWFSGFPIDNNPSPTAIVERSAAPAPTLTKCNANNCLNVMTKTPGVASSFCSTYLQATTTVTVTPTVSIISGSTISPTDVPTTTAPDFVVPSHISSQCVLTSATPLATRLSSACSCLSVSPATGTVTVTSYAPAVTQSSVPGTDCGSLPNPYTVDGDTFNLSCGVIYYGEFIYEYDGLPDMATCISKCVDTEGCVGVDWVAAGVVQDESICLTMDAAIDLTEAIGDTAFLSTYTPQFSS